MKLAILREELLAITDSWQAAVILNHFLFLLKQTKNFTRYIADVKSVLGDNTNLDAAAELAGIKDGWIYKSSRDLSAALMFGWSPSTALKYTDRLVESGLLERRRNPHFNWDKTYQYRPNLWQIQTALAEHGYVLSGFPLIAGAMVSPPPPKPKPTPKKEHSDEELLAVLLAGRTNPTGGDNYDAAERAIDGAGWVIRPDAAKHAAIHFFAALPEWMSELPNSDKLRKKWATGFREHAAEFDLDELPDLYRRAWDELKESGLSITWCGAFTSKMVEIRHKKRRAATRKTPEWFDREVDPQVAALKGEQPNDEK